MPYLEVNGISWCDHPDYQKINRAEMAAHYAGHSLTCQITAEGLAKVEPFIRAEFGQNASIELVSCCMAREERANAWFGGEE